MARNTLTDAQNKYWWGYASRTIEAACLTAGDLHREPNERNQMLRQEMNKAFAAGARWAMRESSQLSPHIAKFIEMMILLGYFEDAESVAQNGDETSGTEESDRTASYSVE